mmetsp:Transcript_33276/g.72954  ORF Transcript_33276/g.72954 Transcript_33276/m.72954 type:complete len:124 (-) Transcript_33276:699-1070(-)
MPVEICPKNSERVVETELAGVLRALSVILRILEIPTARAPFAANVVAMENPAALAIPARRALRAAQVERVSAVRVVLMEKPAALTTTARKTWYATQMERALNAENQGCLAVKAESVFPKVPSA